MNPVQAMVNLITENSKLQSLVNGAFSTNALIEKLSEVSNKELPVLIYLKVVDYDSEYNKIGWHIETVKSDFEAHSWRGSYNLPSIEYEACSAPFSYVDKVIEKLKELQGTEVFGYKGGEYILSKHDPLFIANHSFTGDSTAFIDVIENKDHVSLITETEMY